MLIYYSAQEYFTLPIWAVGRAFFILIFWKNSPIIFSPYTGNIFRGIYYGRKEEKKALLKTADRIL
jgi:hypothetical protein